MRDEMKKARQEKYLSQQELADKVGISREYISMIENGERNPSVNIAKKIATLLKINWVYFFDYQSNETTHSEKRI